MIIYLILIIFLAFLSYAEMLKKIDTSKNRYVYILLFLILFLISGFRREVGTDFINYQNYFKGIFSNTFDYMNVEIGYKIVNYVVAILTSWEQSIFLFTSFFIMFFFFITIKRYSVMPIYSIFCFVTLYFYFHSFNITRQYIAIALTFYGLKYLVDKKLVKYLLIVLLASAFHRVALVMLPFYFISENKYSIKTYLVGILMAIVTMFSLPLLIKIVAFFIPKYSYYIDFTSKGSSAYIPLIISIVGLILTLYTREKNEINENLYFVLTNALYISVLFNILAFSNILMYRIGTFYMVYLIILIPRVVSSLQKDWFHFPTVISSILLITVIYQLINNNSGVVPYNMDISMFIR